MQVPGGSIYLMSTYFSSSKVLVVVGLVGTSISIVDQIVDQIVRAFDSPWVGTGCGMTRLVRSCMAPCR